MASSKVLKNLWKRDAQEERGEQEYKSGKASLERWCLGCAGIRLWKREARWERALQTEAAACQGTEAGPVIWNRDCRTESSREGVGGTADRRDLYASRDQDVIQKMTGHHQPTYERYLSGVYLIYNNICPC